MAEENGQITLLSSDKVPVGGSSTYIVLEFPYNIGTKTKFLLMGSCVSLSYQVYRDKSPVFSLGKNTVRGFAIGNKYVAGSMVLNMFLDDEISVFIRDIVGEHMQLAEEEDLERIRNSSFQDGLGDRQAYVVKDENYKQSHSFMKDDLTAFNIHVIFASEQHGESTKITIYDANFINNGQVMSIDDIVTESTASFVAKNIKEQHRVGDLLTMPSDVQKPFSGSDIVRLKNAKGKGLLLDE